MRKFIDERETDTIITEEQLKQEFEDEKGFGEIDVDVTFEEFLYNCLDKNGTLTEVTNKTKE